MRLYKIVTPEGKPVHGGSGQWPLPDADGNPGEWWDIEGEVVACVNGLHVTDAENVPVWLEHVGAVVYRVETRGTVTRRGEKYVTGSARLTGKPVPCYEVWERLNRWHNRNPEPATDSNYAVWASEMLPENHPALARMRGEGETREQWLKRRTRYIERLLP